MIDHVSIGVSDLARSRAFYEAVFAPLGLIVVGDRGNRIGFGRRYPEFWINLRPGMPRVPGETGNHICLRARTPETVKAFHVAALAHGGADDGPPGPRQATMSAYYAAFVRDPDGHRIEVAAFPEASA